MKSIVWDSPFADRLTAVPSGIAFERGIAQLVPDNVADELLATYDNRFIEPASVLETKDAYGNAYRGTPNPLFGQQRHPHFRLESEKETPYQRRMREQAGVPPVSSDSADTIRVTQNTSAVSATK